MALAKLAALLRQLPEPEVTFESLYAVKEANLSAFTPELPAAPIDLGTPGDSLRKLAHACRCEEVARMTRFHEKNARALRAIRGLTLLQERVNS